MNNNNIDVKPVEIMLGIGIFFIPIIFSWFTLRRGYTTKARAISFVWLFLLSFFYIISDNPTKNIKTENDKVNVKAEFSFTVDEFIKRYNTSLQTLEKDFLFSINEENDNGKYITLKVTSNTPSIGLILSANNNNRALQSIFFIGKGNSSIHSEIDILFGAVAVIMAMEDPYLESADKRGELIKALGLSDGSLKKLGELIVNRDGVQYSLSWSEETGLWIVAEPI